MDINWTLPVYIHMSFADSNVLFVVISVVDSSIKEKRCETILIDFKIVFFPHILLERVSAWTVLV